MKLIFKFLHRIIESQNSLSWKGPQGSSHTTPPAMGPLSGDQGAQSPIQAGLGCFRTGNKQPTHNWSVLTCPHTHRWTWTIVSLQDEIFKEKLYPEERVIWKNYRISGTSSLLALGKSQSSCLLFGITSLCSHRVEYPLEATLAGGNPQASFCFLNIKLWLPFQANLIGTSNPQVLVLLNEGQFLSHACIRISFSAEQCINESRLYLQTDSITDLQRAMVLFSFRKCDVPNIIGRFLYRFQWIHPLKERCTGTK